MTSDLTDWNQEAELDPDKEYRALVRSIRYSRGFGLLFVQCSPAEGTRLIDRVREDLPTKKIEVLKLEEAIDNLFDQVAALPNHDQLNALFIQGIEHSLYEYEGTQLWDNSSDRRSYSQKSVARLLGHLNLGRERFRDHFRFCFIFLVPRFVVKYLVRRAPDFFDWRSGVLEFAMDAERLQQEYQQVYFARSREKDYLSLTPQQRQDETLKIQSLLEEPEQTPEQKANLHFEQALLHGIAGEYEAAIINYDRALDIKPDNYEAWYNRGNSLRNLGRYEEAITSYDRALDIKLDYHEVWNNRGASLFRLGRYEEAITSYDRALDIKPDNYEAWYNRGTLLADLGRHKEAIACYDRALDIKPDNYEAWHNRGISLTNLERYKAGIASFNRALAIKPEYYAALYCRGIVLHLLGRYKDATISYDRALAIKFDEHEAWRSRGDSLRNLGRYEEAIKSYIKSLEFLPNDASALQNIGFCYGMLWIASRNRRSNRATQAIELNPKYREMAKTDSDFDSIRNDDRFQALINKNQND